MDAHSGDAESWAQHALDAPELGDNGEVDWDLFWLYRRKKGVRQPRPLFTGDVFRDVPIIGEESGDVVILQHPCSLLDEHNELRSVLLVAKLIDFEAVTVAGWKGNYDFMPLVVDEGTPVQHRAVAFNELALVRSAELSYERRLACMEIEAAGLLLQRWTNVNTRVVTPLWRFKQVIEEQFAETQGIEDWCSQRQQARVKPAQGIKEATAWLDAKSEDTNRPRRELLKSPQNRKGLIRRMHEVAKEMSEHDIAERERMKGERAAEGTTAAGGHSEVPATIQDGDNQQSLA